MPKIVDIKNGEEKKVFELWRNEEAIYLKVKCSNSQKGHRMLDIKVSDVMYQIIQEIGLADWRDMCREVECC